MKWFCTVSILVFFFQVYPVMPLPPLCQNLVPTSSYVGCFQDCKDDRLLKYFITNYLLLTPEYCIDECRERGYPFAGMEFGAECFCGDATTNLGIPLDEKFCNVACWGDRSRMCGADGIISVYSLNVCPEVPAPPPGQGDSYIGCFKDSVEKKLLNIFVAIIDTPDECIAKCREGGYPYAGMEYSAECFCGDSNTNLGNPTDEMSCNMRCKGAKHKICGGDGMISVYSTTAAPVVPPAQCPVCPVCPVFPVVTNSPCPECPVYPVTPSPKVITFLPPSSFLGCYQDTESIRSLKDFAETYPSLTPEHCIDECAVHGYHFAGLEAGQECYCGSFDRLSLKRMDDVNCTMRCGGDNNKICGAEGFISVYSINDKILSRTIEVRLNWGQKSDIFKQVETQAIHSPYFYLDEYQFTHFVKVLIENGKRYYRFYLFCGKGAQDKPCLAKFRYTFRVLRDNGEPLTLERTQTYNSTWGWGADDYMNVNDLFNGGYIKNEHVNFEVLVRLLD